jgi:hypothetical protein
MTLMDNPRKTKSPKRELFTLDRDSLKVSISLILLYLTILKMLGGQPIPKNKAFNQILIQHPEISDIYKIDNTALIKGISNDLQGLAEIELKSGQTFSKESIENIINSASKRYQIDQNYIRIVQTISNGQLQHFLVFDPKNYLTQEAQNFQWLQWNYFNPIGPDGRRVIDSYGYFVFPRLSGHDGQDLQPKPDYFSLKLSTAR